jgi:hypothetical protein
MPEADTLEEVAELFAVHAEALLASSTREAARSRAPLPPASERASDVPTPSTVLKHLAALPNNKAPGPSGLPKELYSVQGPIVVDLVEVVIDAFAFEYIPYDMALADSVWLWKSKGGVSDLSQYRELSMEEFAIKLVSSILLERLTRETFEYLDVTQAGFRKQRSTRDNSFYLKSLIDLAVEMEQELVIVFIDVKKAFDSVSHALIEEALRDAGASDKSIAMFRAIYGGPATHQPSGSGGVTEQARAGARARCKVRGADGTVVYSREHAVGRGVLQGNVASPWLFLLALHFVFKSCDPSVLESHSMPPPAFQAKLGLLVHSLFYADDAALISASAEDASARLVALKKGMAEMSDMLIHWDEVPIGNVMDVSTWMATSTHIHYITWVLGASSPSDLRGLSNLSNLSATSNLRVGGVALDFAPTTLESNCFLGFAIESNRIESNQRFAHRIKSRTCMTQMNWTT